MKLFFSIVIISFFLRIRKWIDENMKIYLFYKLHHFTQTLEILYYDLVQFLMRLHNGVLQQ